jgi:hypothetical protein
MNQVTWWRRAAITVIVLAVTAAPHAAAAAAACPPTWNHVATPNRGQVDNGLAAVAAVDPHDMWAVGSAGTYGGKSSTLAEHFDGVGWSVVATPNGPNAANRLGGVTAVATDDVWAVGSSATNPPTSSHSVTLVEHWTAGVWSVVPSPNPAPPLGGAEVSNELYGVAAVATDDVWAVGQSFDFTTSQTLIVHWNGRSWRAVHAPHPGFASVLRSVTAVSANDVWAAGTTTRNGRQHTLVLHWDGHAWTQVPSPDDGPYLQEVMRIRAVGPNDVWMVGYHLAVFGFDENFQTSIFHWDGTAWSVVPSPDMNQENNYLFAVDGISSTDAWAVGFFDTGTALQTMAQHWNGASWSVVPSPNTSDIIDELDDVVALGHSDVWSVGQFAGPASFRTLALHFDSACGP